MILKRMNQPRKRNETEGIKQKPQSSPNAIDTMNQCNSSCTIFRRYIVWTFKMNKKVDLVIQVVIILRAMRISKQ